MTKQKCVQSVPCWRQVLQDAYIPFFPLYRMKDKGYELSGKGVSIKTSKRFDRQDYIDATQRCVSSSNGTCWASAPVIVDNGHLFYWLNYRNMIKTMTATSFNRRPDSQSPNSSTQATSSFAARPVIVDRAGGKKSAFGSLRKNTTWEPRVLSWIGWGGRGWWFIWDVISVLCVLCWSIVALATDH